MVGNSHSINSSEYLTAGDLHWPAQKRPASGAPNVVTIVLDDTGFAQLGCFGSTIATPHMDQLAENGLRYNKFHVTAMCSPTRASVLTGRNHHATGMGFLSDLPLAFPGYTGRVPPSVTPLPRLLRDAGYSTLAVGKWHLTPRFERSAAGPFTSWPLGYGFERYYGFLNGDTNHWAPSLVRDNHYVEQPVTPEDGYHLTEDLADTAIQYVLDQQHAAPGKPFFLYFAAGASHSPHHVTPEWSDPYRGQFDQGWEAWREHIFAQQVASGVIPEDTVLTPRPEWIREWESLSADEKRMHARQQEVYAGFLTHTDAQIGRLVSFLESIGQLDNTVIMLLSDNGASAEGGEEGSFNEHRFTSRIPDTLQDNLAHFDGWGGHETYNHYSWAWAWAGNTPFRLWKRYTWLGGTRTPLIVHWPRGIREPGNVRQQFVHATDLFPTILDVCGVEVPSSVDGVEQKPVDGASIRPSFSDPDAHSEHTTQYFELLGSRSIIHHRWKATTDHVSTGVADEEKLLRGSRSFDEDRWALFDLHADFSESRDLADQHRDVVEELQRRWIEEAERNNVLPLKDTLIATLSALIGPAWPPGTELTFHPGGGPICDESLPLLISGFRFTADIHAQDTSEGVLFAIGDWNGGYALYAVDGYLAFSFSRAGELLEVTADRRIPPGQQQLGVVYQPYPDGSGTFQLLHGETSVGEVRFNGPIPLGPQHGGAGLRLGFDTGFPVTSRYSPPARWNGVLEKLRVSTPDVPLPDPFEDFRMILRAAMHAD